MPTVLFERIFVYLSLPLLHPCLAAPSLPLLPSPEYRNTLKRKIAAAGDCLLVYSFKKIRFVTDVP